MATPDSHHSKVEVGPRAVVSAVADDGHHFALTDAVSGPTSRRLLCMYTDTRSPGCWTSTV